MNIDTIFGICFVGIFLAVFVGPIACSIYSHWANDIRWEDEMLPCPKCGHRAITVHYTGENNPYFFTAECGAYVRRGEDNIGSVGATRRRNDPPMTEAQKKCKFCAGYCAEVPHFATRRGAVKWWNSFVESEKRWGQYKQYKVTLVRKETFRMEAASMSDVRAEVDRRRNEDLSIVDFEIEEVR